MRNFQYLTASLAPALNPAKNISLPVLTAAIIRRNFQSILKRTCTSVGSVTQEARAYSASSDALGISRSWKSGRSLAGIDKI